MGPSPAAAPASVDSPSRCETGGRVNPNPPPAIITITLPRRDAADAAPSLSTLPPMRVDSLYFSPHFPYQPCRACRNQQQNYPM